MLRTAIISLIVLMSATAANAACGPFPRSNFIGSFSHEQVQQYVAQAHAGDWAPYIDMLDANYERLLATSRRGVTTTLRVRGEPVEMTAKELARFAYISRQFNDVVKCLASLPEADAIDLNDFATAAGSTQPETQPAESISRGPTARSVNLIGMGTGRDAVVKLTITPECRVGDTIFVVRNEGVAWPDTGMFTMFRMDGENRQMIGAKRLTFGTGDEREFTISSSQNRTGHVGIAVDPSWYDRSFTIDADARCS